MSCGRSPYTFTRKLRVREDGAKPSPPRDCKAAPIAREPLSGRVVSGQPDGKAARYEAAKPGDRRSLQPANSLRRISMGQPSPPARDGRGGLRCDEGRWELRSDSPAFGNSAWFFCRCLLWWRSRVVCGFAIGAYGQETATIEGMLTDPTGGAVSGANIVAQGISSPASQVRLSQEPTGDSG